jgi:hypothetical protein
MAWCDFAVDPTATNFVKISVQRRPWQWLGKRSGKKAWTVHGKTKLTETEKGETSDEQR